MTGEELEAIRQELGLATQAEMAELIACDTVGYRRYATGARPVPRYVARSAELLCFIHAKGLLAQLKKRLDERPYG